MSHVKILALWAKGAQNGCEKGACFQSSVEVPKVTHLGE